MSNEASHDGEPYDLAAVSSESKEVDDLSLPAPSNPMGVARELVADYQYEDVLTLRHWRGAWTRWERMCWVELEDRAVRSWLYGRLEHAQYWHDDPKGGPELKPWRPNRRKIADVLDALAAATHLSEAIDPPAWLDDSPIQAGEVVACTNGLLHVGTKKLDRLTPLYFNRVAVPFDWDPAAPPPNRWLGFLNQLWPDDADSSAALQQFFGYVLSGRTDLHKVLLLIGPTRSGKGTIARVLAAIVGKGNVSGPTLASLGTNFGMAPLLGKPLAVVSDARLGGSDVHQVVERLLSISGEDTLTVDRKFRDPWTGELPSRFFILSNELPRFGDASGAIAHRFIVLTLANSWLGHENPRLTDQLLGELPGILAWSLDGLDQLVTNGKFTEPASSGDAILALQDLVSPVAAFVRDHCTTGAGLEVPVSELYGAWKAWCEDNGRDKPGTVQTFGRDLRAVVPRLRVHRPWADDGKTRLPRRYVGITKGSTARNGEYRGLSRSEQPADSVDRDRPRPTPLRPQLDTEHWLVSGEPLHDPADPPTPTDDDLDPDMWRRAAGGYDH